jgi:hypothetical protein
VFLPLLCCRCYSHCPPPHILLFLPLLLLPLSAPATCSSITSSSLPLLSLPPLFHRHHHLFSPWMHHDSCMSFGMIVTCFVWIAHSLVSSKRQTGSALRSLLEGKKGRALHLQIQLKIDCNLADNALKGCLPDQKVSVLLVFMDLTNGDGPRAVMMGLLRATSGSGLLLCSLCCKLMV